MLYCPHCGIAAAEAARFCWRCGHDLRAARALLEVSVQRATAGQAQPPDAARAELRVGHFERGGTRYVRLGASEFRLPSWWRRAGGHIVDVVMVAIVGSAVGGWLGAALHDWSHAADVTETDLASTLAFLCGAVFGVAYWWAGCANGRTLGMRAAGLRVVDGEGAAPGVDRGFARMVGAYLSVITLGLGYLWAAWDPRRQTWHDKAAGTYVVLAN